MKNPRGVPTIKIYRS